MGLAGDVPGGPYVISNSQQAPIGAWTAGCRVSGRLRIVHNLRQRLFKGVCLSSGIDKTSSFISRDRIL